MAQTRDRVQENTLCPVIHPPIHPSTEAVAIACNLMKRTRVQDISRCFASCWQQLFPMTTHLLSIWSSTSRINHPALIRRLLLLQHCSSSCFSHSWIYTQSTNLTTTTGLVEIKGGPLHSTHAMTECRRQIGSRIKRRNGNSVDWPPCLSCQRIIQ